MTMFRANTVINCQLGAWEGWNGTCAAARRRFVRNGFKRPAGDAGFTFLVSGVRAAPVRYLGSGVRSVRLNTTLGVVEIAGFPEAMEALEAELSRDLAGSE